MSSVSEKKEGLKPVICLPTKNEEKSIQLMIDKLKALNIDFFVVDEHSSDQTCAIAKKNGVKVYQRDCSGKGCGIIKAVEIARREKYDVLITIDCDNTYPSEEIPKMLSFMPEYDAVLGVRSWDNIPPVHRIGNIVHTMAINVLYFSWLKDINSGMRALNLNSGAFDKLDAYGFDIEAQMTIRALRHKLNVKQHMVKYEQRVGDSKIRLKDGLTILWRIFIERFRKLK